MHLGEARIRTAVVSALVAAACVVVLALLLTRNLDGFMVWEVWPQILGISAAAGLLRMPFRRGGIGLSVVGGVVVAVAGVIAVVLWAMYQI
jgi:hypothetical protein